MIKPTYPRPSNPANGRHARPVGRGNIPDGRLAEFKQQFRQFVAEREWQQFHSPKNLAMALAGEAGELLELFQWLTQEESRNLPDDAKQAVAHEIADIQIYLAAISDRLGINIGPAVTEKMKLNAEKYPAELARGNALKYSKLQPWNPNPARGR